MSFESVFNQNTREDFKKSINYPMLAEQRVPERRVQLEWQKSLQKITDAEGTEWTGAFSELILGQQGEGRLGVTLQSSKGTAIVKITSLSGCWKQRLDYLIWTESLTNRNEVNLKVAPGIEDLYLVPKSYPQAIFVSFLYGNFYVSVKHWEQGDIGTLAKAIRQLMEDNSQLSVIDKSSFKITADKTRLAIGETVAIKIEGVAQNWNSQWQYNQPQQLLGDEVELLEQKDQVFVFKALKKGKIQIPFTAMHTPTMYVESRSIELEIN